MEFIKTCLSKLILQFAQHKWALLGVFGLALGPIGVAILIHQLMNVSFGQLTRDIVVISDLPVYSGFMSQLTIFIWAITVGFCFLNYQLAKKLKFAHKFYLNCLLLTLLLGIDDTFLLHEAIFPKFGISEHLVYLSYIVYLLLILIIFKNKIIESQFVFLFVSLTFFAISVFFDVTNGLGIDAYITEDGTKLVGVIFWAVYFNFEFQNLSELKTKIIST